LRVIENYKYVRCDK